MYYDITVKYTQANKLGDKCLCIGLNFFIGLAPAWWDCQVHLVWVTVLGEGQPTKKVVQFFLSTLNRFFMWCWNKKNGWGYVFDHPDNFG